MSGLIVKIAKMPIPKKKDGEKQTDFMIRCVPIMMKEYDKSQAIAICFDAYKNNKYQCLFNTENQLYLIDRNGKVIDYYDPKIGADVIEAKIEELLKD